MSEPEKPRFLWEYEIARLEAALKEAERERDAALASREEWRRIALSHDETITRLGADYAAAEAQLTRVREALGNVDAVLAHQGYGVDAVARQIIAAALAEPAAGAPKAPRMRAILDETCPTCIEVRKRFRDGVCPEHLVPDEDPYLTSDYDSGGGSEFGPPISTPGGKV